MSVIGWLKLSETKSIKDLDDVAVTRLHSGIISRKGFLKKIYLDSYEEFKKIQNNSGNGFLVELGSGGGLIKQVIPTAITSDVVKVDNIDLCFSAESLPFQDNTVDGFFMLNVLHHIKKPEHFLRELSRCLKADGKILIIEPANTLWSRFIYQRFHHEDFDPEAGWGLDKQGRLSAANDALGWIIFVRDKEIFENEFPGLRIKKIKLHTPLRYLISGGLSLRQLLPSWAYQPVKGLEYILSPLNRYIGMFMSVELDKV
ncbi:MAG: class I SAM-dependent methyltransferase [Candidatus Omnitrophota bacterium]